MKNIKLLFAMMALLVFPFFAKAQIIIPHAPDLTVSYVDHGYGTLTCTLKTSGFPGQTYIIPIANGTSHTYATNDRYWSTITFSTPAADIPTMNVSVLEGQAIGVEVGYNYVTATGGSAPQFTIRRNSAYNYTVTSWLTPL